MAGSPVTAVARPAERTERERCYRVRRSCEDRRDRDAWRSRAGPRGRPRGRLGGGTAVFSDGSVHFLKASISIRVFARLVTRAGGEVVSGDDF